MGNFPIIDVIFLVLIILMVLHGFVKGFIEEIFSWAGLVLSMLAAVLLYHPGAAFIRTKAMANVRFIPEILAFIVIFLIVMIFIKILERILKDIIVGTNLGGANKVLGAIFGLVQGFALVAIILFILYVQPLFDHSKVIGDSVFARILLPVILAPMHRGKEVIHAARLFMIYGRFPA